MRYLVMTTLTFVFALTMSSCKDKVLTEEQQAEVDEAIILDYLEDNNVVATEVEGGVFIEHITEGAGENPDANSTVSVTYVGNLIDGEVFDRSRTPIEFNLNNVIEGWQIGIPYLKEGGSGRLFIPSGKAYGNNAVGSIPENAVLVFEVDLISIVD